MRSALAFGRPVSFASWAPSDFYVNGARRQAPYVCSTPKARSSHHFAPCFDRDVISHTAAHRARKQRRLTPSVLSRARSALTFTRPRRNLWLPKAHHTHALWIFAATLFANPTWWCSAPVCCNLTFRLFNRIGGDFTCGEAWSKFPFRLVCV
jgi:hypothetical protein